MQTIEGARKARETRIAKCGGEEAYYKYMREQAARGGEASGTGGFYHMKANGQDEKIREAAAKGGSISRRGPSKKTLEAQAKAEVNQVVEKKRKTWSFKFARSN